MGKATITVKDEGEGVTFSVEFDPELRDDSEATPAQAVAIGILEKIASDGLEQSLAPFVENPEEQPQPKEKINDGTDTSTGI